jgi:hypothetical protein
LPVLSRVLLLAFGLLESRFWTYMHARCCPTGVCNGALIRSCCSFYISGSLQQGAGALTCTHGISMLPQSIRQNRAASRHYKTEPRSSTLPGSACTSSTVTHCASEAQAHVTSVPPHPGSLGRAAQAARPAGLPACMHTHDWHDMHEERDVPGLFATLCQTP